MSVHKVVGKMIKCHSCGKVSHHVTKCLIQRYNSPQMQEEGTPKSSLLHKPIGNPQKRSNSHHMHHVEEAEVDDSDDSED